MPRIEADDSRIQAGAYTDQATSLVTAFQAQITLLETDLNFQKGWGEILEEQREKDRVVKKEVERNTIIILRQALSKLSYLSLWLKNRTDIWFVSPKQLTNVADRNEYIERYNEIIELLTWAVLLAQSLVTIDPEDETYKQTFDMLQRLLQQREEIKKEWDFFDLLDDVYVTEFHKNLNRLASALTTSVDVKYRSDIVDKDWLAITHIANQRPFLG